MEYSNIVFVLLLAFPLGMLHALDADHVAAVTGMSDRCGSIKNSIRFCLNWALGHSLTLMFIGTIIFLFSIAIPESFSSYAEFLVGMLLVAIGIGLAMDIRRKNLHLHFHQHDNQLRHAHWHAHEKNIKDEHKHQHRAVLIGVLHGAAGYAPLIALIPLAANDSPWFAISYLLLFGAGVFVAMLLVGGVIGVVFRYLGKKSNMLMNLFRAVISAVSIFLGSALMVNVVLA